jgi:hypothetical protein
MPLGSSSAAPVIRPGPRILSIFAVRAKALVSAFRLGACRPVPGFAPAGMLGFEALDFSDVPIAKFYFAVKTRSGAQKSNNHLRAFLLLCCHL